MNIQLNNFDALKNEYHAPRKISSSQDTTAPYSSSKKTQKLSFWTTVRLDIRPLVTNPSPLIRSSILDDPIQAEKRGENIYANMVSRTTNDWTSYFFPFQPSPLRLNDR